MSIENVYKITDASKTADVQKALDHLAQQVTGVKYMTEVPDVKSVPFGTLVIYDDGSSKRMYVRTGKDNIGYVVLS